MDHENTRTLGISGGVEPHVLPPDEQLAVVGTVEAHQEIAESGLSGPVLTEQGVHLAVGRLE